MKISNLKVLVGTDKLKDYIEYSKSAIHNDQDLERVVIEFENKNSGVDYCVSYTTTSSSEIITSKFLIDVSSYGIELSCPERSSYFPPPTIEDFMEFINKSDSHDAIKSELQNIFNLLLTMRCSPRRALDLLDRSIRKNGLEMSYELSQGMLNVFKKCFPANYEEYSVVSS